MTDKEPTEVPIMWLLAGGSTSDKYAKAVNHGAGEFVVTEWNARYNHSAPYLRRFYFYSTAGVWVTEPIPYHAD